MVKTSRVWRSNGDGSPFAISVVVGIISDERWPDQPMWMESDSDQVYFRNADSDVDYVAETSTENDFNLIESK